MNDGFLKYFIIHLKNIIFFKSSIYLIVIVISIWLIQIADKELIKASSINDRAENSINEAKVKLNSIAYANKDILNSIDKYKKILSATLEEGYNKRNNLKNDLYNTINKYNLSEPANITITQFFFNNKEARLSCDNINIANYDIKLNFMTQTFMQAFSIIKECYSIMPENTIIISLVLEHQSVLNRNMVHKLSTIKLPHLIDVKLNMRIREITYSR